MMSTNTAAAKFKRQVILPYRDYLEGFSVGDKASIVLASPPEVSPVSSLYRAAADLSSKSGAQFSFKRRPVIVDADKAPETILFIERIE